MFPATIIHRVFGTNSSFRVGWCTPGGGGSFLFFGGFVLAEFSFWRGGWGRGYHSMGFGHFPDVS